MSSGLIEIIKTAALNAVDNAQMCDLRFGTVVNTSPLNIKVTNQLIIPESLLIVPEHLTDHQMIVTADWNTGYASDHSHPISGTTTLMVRGSLKLGDKVALLRKQGGQSYFILDRI